MNTKVKVAAALMGLALAGCSKPYAVAEKSVNDLNADLAAGKVTSAQLTQAYLDRIKTEDKVTKSVLAINPKALDAAKASDARRKAGKLLSPLDGIPILIKDNIDFAGMATTAGSIALKDNIAAQDAPMVHRLVEAGAVILGKTNLSEWANYRSTWSTSGWSGMGGLTRNPYDPRRTACGSSSGSGAAGALSLAALTIGTETSGSVTCPAGMNGLVGIKPTIALVARTGIIPISHNQDTAGPMTRTVADTAVLLTYMAGSDASDPQTAEADAHKTDYVKGLDKNSLKGARIGVMRFQKGYTPETQAVFEKALEALKAQGADLVEINDFSFEDLSAYKGNILETDFKEDLNAYLAKTPPAVKTRNLADLLAFSKAEPKENVLFGHEIWEKSVVTTGFDDPDYVKLKEAAQRTRGPEGIDKLLTENNVVALVQPTGEPAGLIDTATHLRNGAGGPSAAGIPAVAGYPHLTVPMGAVSGLPVGISFIGPKWSEQTLLSLGYAYEQATHMRRPPDGKAGQGPL
ncbi:MAG: amidase [Rhodospirillaceae bacterium]|nr:amidase [Rhodospirillaceae bacterium]